MASPPLSFLFSSSPTGTLGRWVTGVAAELAGRGHGVAVLVPGEQTGWRFDELTGVEVRAWPRHGERGWYRAADRAIAETRPDAVVGSFSGDNHLLLAGARRRVPTRASWHHTPWAQLRLDEGGGPRFRALCARKRLVYRLATDVLVATPPSAEDVRRRFGVPEAKVTVEPYALPDPGRPEVERVPGRVVVVGRLYPSKGHDWLLRAVPAVARRVPDLEVRVLGQGPLEAELRRQADPHCTFLPPVDRDGLFAELASAQVAVVPSRAEGFGLVTVEAQAVGTPVVASAIGPFRSTVAEGRSGLLVPVDDHVALSETLIRVLTDDPLRERLGHGARRHFEERFDLARRAPELADRYEALAR